MNDEVRNHPRVSEHWPHCASPIIASLHEDLLMSAMGAKGDSFTAQREIGELREKARIILKLRSITDKPAAPAPRPAMTPLRRFDTPQPEKTAP